MKSDKLKKKKLSYKTRKQIRDRNSKIYNYRKLQPRVVLKFTRNNIFFNILCRLKKDPSLFATIFWLSCGSKKFSLPQYKGSSRKSYIANYSIGIFIAKKLKRLKLRENFTIILKSFEKHFKILIQALKKSYRRRFNLLDLSPISLNGCRFKKVRRV